MSCEKIELMISLYLDDELTKEEESYLFTHLNTCTNCRDEFKRQNIIQSKVVSGEIDVRNDTDMKIFQKIGERKHSVLKIIIGQSKITYALAAVLIIMAITAVLQFNQTIDYKNRLIKAEVEVGKQNKLINSLIQGPAREETANNIIKPIIIKSTRL